MCKLGFTGLYSSSFNKSPTITSSFLQLNTLDSRTHKKGRKEYHHFEQWNGCSPKDGNHINWPLIVGASFLWATCIGTELAYCWRVMMIFNTFDRQRPPWVRTEEAFLECLANMNRSNVNCLPVCNLYQAYNMNVVLSNHSVALYTFFSLQVFCSTYQHTR